jgi:cation diffusion facilitator family transporter
MNAQRQKTMAAALSVASNTTLVAAKLAVGLITGSLSVMAEAAHSTVDLVAAAIALFAVRFSNRPADEDHAFGHGKVENLSGLAEAVLIFAAAAWIGVESIDRLRAHSSLNVPGWGVLIMAASAVMNYAVSKHLLAVGTATDSMALRADAWHLRTDVYTSIGVMSGLALYWAGTHLFSGLELHWIDPTAAIAVALLITRAAYTLSAEAISDLMDARLPAASEAVVDRIVRTHQPVVRGYHNLRTRKAGHQAFIDMHLVVDADMTVLDSHDVAMRITRAIERELPGSNATVHVEPCVHCTPRCLAGCLLTAEERRRLKGEPAATG